MRKVDITSAGAHEYVVTVSDGGAETKHRVRVPQDLRDTLGIPEVGQEGQEGGEERLVRESFAFLLEREPASSILREFDLDVISRYFPEYRAEIRSRLG